MSDPTDDAGPEEVAPRPSGAGLPQPGDVVAERYRIEREIGHGGMAVVYAATQLSGGNRQVALKWLFQGRSHRDERRRRFLREARAAGSIEHRNVVRVYDAGEHKDGVYLVMELVAGRSLTAYLQEHGKLAPRDAIDLLMPALRGVAAAHKNGIIHRDLKPDNLYVCPPKSDGGRPEIKVLDFGLSKLIGPAADSLHTIPGTLVGTPQYMAPEQADHRLGDVSERSDVYALAAILYEAIAGRRPFESETLTGQLMKIAHEEPTPIREVVDVPEPLADTIMWALAREPAQRPASIEDFALELEPFASAGFADDGRMSEHKGSLRPRRISDRAPSASVRAPAAQPASVAPPPAQAAGASKGSPSARTWGWAALAIALLGVATFALLHTRADDQAATAEPAPSSKPPAATAAPQAAPSAPHRAPPEPPARDAAPDAGLAAEPPPGPDTLEQEHAKRPRAPRAAPEAPSPPATAAPQATPEGAPAIEAAEPAPAPARRKRSPGVADPWAD